MKQVVFDAGALIALDRGAASVRGYVLLADRAVVALLTSSGAVAQVWRDGARQARLARFLSGDLITEVPLDAVASRRIGVLAAVAGTKDVVDGHVALIALDHDAVVLTSDPKDISSWGVDDKRIVRC